MKNLILTFMLAVLCQVSTTSAQSADTTLYVVYAYMKVAPGEDAEYLKMEKAYKKLHAAEKKAGILDNWALFSVMSPYGTDCAYNYIAVNVLRGDKQLAGYYEGSGTSINWQSLLTKEELDLVNRTNAIRSLVKEEVWTITDDVSAPDWEKGKIAVFNYFSSPAGKTRADHIKVEQDIWKPIHAARVKDGKMTRWALMNLEFPFGAAMPYNMATIDFYTDMNAYLAGWFDTYFAKVHPGKDASELIRQTNAACSLDRGEVRMVLDRLDWK